MFQHSVIAGHSYYRRILQKEDAGFESWDPQTSVTYHILAPRREVLAAAGATLSREREEQVALKKEALLHPLKSGQLE